MSHLVTSSPYHHVVIIGGGFGGLYAAKALRRAPVQVTLVDRRNFHLFQPLLYQVATGLVSPGEIASPLRAILSRHRNTSVIAAEVVDVDPDKKCVILNDGEVFYDSLIVATGVSHDHFGHDEWADLAPGLKTLEDGLEIRRRVFLAFEMAERETDPGRRRAWMTFVVVGGGPHGVELAGSLGELARNTLVYDFRHINPADAQIYLLEGKERVLPTYPPSLSGKAEVALRQLGVTVRPNTLVTDVQPGIVTVRQGQSVEQTPVQTILWAAGVKASPFGPILAQRTGAPTDNAGRLIVEPDLTLPGHPNIFVIGDLAHFAHQTGAPLPGVAQVAMQQGRYAAQLITARIQGRNRPPFHYKDKGSLAVIGRNRAVADIGRLHLSGFLAWLVWAFIHIAYLIEFDNKVLIMTEWAWTYFTGRRGTRLITGDYRLPFSQPDINGDVTKS